MMLVKPVDAGVLRRAAKRLLETVPPTSAADLDDESVRAGDESDDDVPVVDVG
jgi:hypothetical protein